MTALANVSNPSVNPSQTMRRSGSSFVRKAGISGPIVVARLERRGRRSSRCTAGHDGTTSNGADLSPRLDYGTEGNGPKRAWSLNSGCEEASNTAAPPIACEPNYRVPSDGTCVFFRLNTSIAFSCGSPLTRSHPVPGTGSNLLWASAKPAGSCHVRQWKTPHPVRSYPREQLANYPFNRGDGERNIRNLCSGDVATVPWIRGASRADMSCASLYCQQGFME